MSSKENHRKARRHLQMAFDLYDAGKQIMRQNLQRRYPDESDQQINLRLRQWLLQRPGAEQGDAEGTPVPWPRKET